MDLLFLFRVCRPEGLGTLTGALAFPFQVFVIRAKPDASLYILHGFQQDNVSEIEFVFS